MAKRTWYRYTVRGYGSFPIDMLRYDCAFPAGESVSHIMTSSRFGSHEDVHDVELIGVRRPTDARWSSFGWTVVKVEPQAPFDY
jgi:hypothetical protein